MKTLSILFATSLFAATASADDIYHGFGRGNPDLVPWHSSFAAVASVAAPIDYDIYHGFADGNPDLWDGQSLAEARVVGVQPGIGDDTGVLGALPQPAVSSRRIEIYGGFTNPDLGDGRF